MKSKTCTGMPPLKIQVRLLRKQGFTYTEICNKLGPISKSTLADWFQDIQLDKNQQQRIREKILISAAKAHPLARQALREKQEKWRAAIKQTIVPISNLPYTDPDIFKFFAPILPC